MIVTLFFGFTTLGFMPIVSCSQTQNTIQKVKSISTNNIHGCLISNTKNKETGIQAINGYINKQEYDLLLDGGDLIQGTSLNDIDKGNAIAKITSLMNYDALAVGNHEFDFLLDNILNITNKVQKTFFLLIQDI